MKELLDCCSACLTTFFIWGIFAVIFYLLYPVIMVLAIISFCGIVFGCIYNAVNKRIKNTSERFIDEE